MKIDLGSWIIRDGNYDDFVAGNKYKFALEFHPGNISKVNSSGTGFNYIDSARYKITAQVKFVSDSCWIVDFGLLAFSTNSAEINFKVGQYIDTEAYLGVDPFFYFESLCKEKDIPPLMYEWKLNRIWLNTTPWIESKNNNGQVIKVRDESKISFQEVTKTNAWQDDKGDASYLLEVENIGTAPA